ncbi:excinuclease ABC subunit C [Candidatus Peregrinibacteria bacterium CG10_big_fil_rev_8_21_14_0_10_49_24]|nr:MAG: excinuclease ABC subunit C [Candidatus Peregrinibacteria bacterium CG11_big_fil_rev_8_21_14_0_20_49_14]PIR50347.1 MAG: excinuclease ABC subunit C [Candidatus Peregrinibacteria bacterium CG10_big_fil_rev_8_21_14_0_10_49_24]PJA67773.1 MAG: excinuclease ABC subunit C [Candidatus Peregrinibacteria bacterium CG_4_9_14_3_um_filter_49_12]
MYFVYSLESADCQHWYVGLTDDVHRRLAEHNAGKSMYTNKHRPWKISSYTAFHDRKRAQEFERYLKSHSGRAFAMKHL